MIKKAKILPDFFTLRRMEERDLSAVLEIENLSYPNPWREMTFRGEIQNAAISFPYTIDHKYQQRVIGYIIFWVVKDRAQINNIAIHPDFRRMGVAEAVMRQVLDFMPRAGVELATLEVRPSNVAARSLYKKLGFELLWVRQNYYNNPREDALILGKYFRQPTRPS